MNYQFLYQICVCFLLSFFIGLERQYRRKIIGLRTSILVAIGSFLFVSFTFTVGGSDISRIASQIVAGMGFLGAGVILKDGKKIRGLTTAATIWCSAAIGTLCAGGAVFEAIIGTFIILFSNIVLRYINKMVNNISGSLDLQLEYNIFINGNDKSIEKIKNKLDEYFKNNNIEIISLNFTKEILESNINYNILIKKNNNYIINEIEKLILENKLKSFSITKLNETKIDEFDD